MVNHIVTIVGLSSYTSGAQLCNGAADTLNKYPTIIKTIHKLNPCNMDVFSLTLIKLYILSKFVNPV